MTTNPLLEIYEERALNAASAVVGAPDLPYPAMPVPPFRQVAHGRWRFSQAMLLVAPGYFNGIQPLTWTPSFLVRDDVTWMSVVPMEVESQMPHLAHAHGTVAICGLGLGVITYAMAAKRAVEKVIVVERDPELAELFRQFACFDLWPHKDKVEIVLADATDCRLDGVDFLYADIWPQYRMDVMIADMRKIHRNIPAPACGYWGQELDMVDHALSNGVAIEDFAAQHVQAFAEAHELPLIGLEQADYPALCVRAARNPAISASRVPVQS